MDASGEDFDEVAARAYALYLADKARQAIAMANYASTIRPESEYPHRIRAISYRRLRRRKKAVEAATKAADLAPDEPLLQCLLADLHLDRQDLPKALHAAANAVRLGPERALTHACLARVHLESQRFDEAGAAVRRAIELDPELVEATETAAELLVHNRAFGRTFADLRAAAVDLGDPDRARSLLYSAETFLRGGVPPLTSSQPYGTFPVFLRTAFSRRKHNEGDVGLVPGIGRRADAFGIVLIFAYPFVRISMFLERRRRLRALPPDIREAVVRARKHPAIRRERLNRLFAGITAITVELGLYALVLWVLSTRFG